MNGSCRIARVAIKSVTGDGGRLAPCFTPRHSPVTGARYNNGLQKRNTYYMVRPMNRILTRAELWERLQLQVRRAGSQRAWAREHQVNVGTVSKALANRSDLTSPKILAALGVEAVYQVKGDHNERV